MAFELFILLLTLKYDQLAITNSFIVPNVLQLSQK